MDTLQQYQVIFVRDQGRILWDLVLVVHVDPDGWFRYRVLGAQPEERTFVPGLMEWKDLRHGPVFMSNE